MTTYNYGRDILGVDYASVQAEAQSIQHSVSPWLWILSITGFGLAMWSKYQINKMYGNYKKMKRELLHVEQEIK